MSKNTHTKLYNLFRHPDLIIDDKESALIACGINPRHYKKMIPSLQKDNDIILMLLERHYALTWTASDVFEMCFKNINFEKADLYFLQVLFKFIDDTILCAHIPSDEPLSVICYQHIFPRLPPIMRGTLLFYQSKKNDKLGAVLKDVLKQNKYCMIDIPMIAPTDFDTNFIYELRIHK